MPAAGEDLYFGAGYEPSEFFGKVGRGDDVVLSPDHQRGGLDTRQFVRSIKREHGVDARRDDLDWRKRREVLRLGLAQSFIIAGDPPTRVQKQCGCLHIDACTETLQQLLAQAEEATKIGVRLGPCSRKHDAREPIWVF